MSQRKVIIKTAVYSRLLLFFIQYISNIVLPDHNADAFRYPKPEDHGLVNILVTHFFGGFLRWDAHYFTHVSIHGYTYEHILAFFPLFPVLVRFVTSLLSFIPLLSIDSLTLLVSISINTFCFIQSALCLYELSLHVVHKELAYKASILFCYNPASIFFTALYSESLFCYLTFKSMLNCVLLYKKYCDNHVLRVRDVVYIIPICLGTITRSNGVLNIGFLVYTLMCLYLEKVKLEKQTRDKLLYTLKFIILTIFLTSFCLFPFILFQIYSYFTFCKNYETNLPSLILEHKDINNFILPGTFSKHSQSWCFKKIPLAYSYVQSHYWKVGFLQYFEFKQIPNFLLATPIIVIVLKNAFWFFKNFPKEISKVFNFHLLKTSPTNNKSKFSPVMIVFVIHATILTIFCVLNIHVQVTTRMLCSASPVLYWFSASYVPDISQNNLFGKLFSKRCNREEFLLISYYLSYYVVGTAMFCNFLPWT